MFEQLIKGFNIDMNWRLIDDFKSLFDEKMSSDDNSILSYLWQIAPPDIFEKERSKHIIEKFDDIE